LVLARQARALAERRYDWRLIETKIASIARGVMEL
jgi:hypothetical protein